MGEGHRVHRRLMVEELEARVAPAALGSYPFDAKLLASDGAADDSMGYSVSVDGEWAVVGLCMDDVGPNPNQGSACIYHRESDGAWTEVKRIVASDGAATELFGVSVCISGDTVVVAASNDNFGWGAAYVFSRNQGGVGNWGQVKKLTASDGPPGGAFAASVSISGDTIVVGAHYSNPGGTPHQGSAYVYSRNQGGADNWGEVKTLVASDGAENDYFGWSVSISGDTILVGARDADVGGNDDQGAAYVFSRNQGGAENWGEVTKLTASDGATEDGFGVSLSISGDTLVVGSPFANIGANGDEGAAYVFSRNQGGAETWGEVEKLTASDGAAMSQFGCGVSIDGDVVLVGVQYADVGGNLQQGSAYVFWRNQGGADNWGETEKLTASDGAEGDCFGYSVSIGDHTALVGAIYDADNGAGAGSAYIFDDVLFDVADDAYATPNDTAKIMDVLTNDTAPGQMMIESFTQPAVGGVVSDNGDGTLTFTPTPGYTGDATFTYTTTIEDRLFASDGALGDSFGCSVAVDGDWAVVGAAYDDVDVSADQGSAYIYHRGSNGVWTQVKRLTASDGAAGDLFGAVVCISGDMVVVGAYMDESGQGAAYLFSLNQGGVDNWGQLTKLTASDGMIDDWFGYSVSISNDVLIIGASHDDIGANGNQGSAYAFARNQGGPDLWGQMAKLTASDGAADDWFGCSVSIAADTTVVGASRDDVGLNADQGSAYIFSRNQGGADVWGQVTKLTASDGAADDWFGCSVSIANDTVVVGASHDDVGTNADQGSAYLFSRNQGGADAWGEVVKITASDGAADDWFGCSVSISSGLVVVGASHDHVGLNADQGSAYLFSRNEGGANNWGEVKQLAASDGAADDYFGCSVCLSGDTVIAGAYGDDIGSNGDQGSACLFANWASREATVTVTVKAPNAPPTIALLTDGPDPVYRPFRLTLTASGVNDPDGTVTAVEFYVDENANNTVDVGIDTLLGTGTNAGGGVWAWSDYTYGWALGSYTYLARAQDNQGAWSDAAVTTGDVAGLNTIEVVPGQVILYDTDLGEALDISAADVLVKLDTKDGSVKSVTIVGNPTGLGILVNSIGTKAVTIKDARKTKAFPILEEISFVVCMGSANQISLKSPLVGWNVGPVLRDEGLVGDADLDGDEDTDDLTSIYCGAPTKTVKVMGQVGGDVVVEGADAKFVGLGKLDVKNGNIAGEVVTTDGGLKMLGLKGGNLLGNVIVNGVLGKLSVKAGKDATGAPIGGTIDGVDILVTGLAKGIGADAIANSLIAALNIGSVSVKTNLTDSHIHAGGTVDRDHNWTAGHGSIKGVTVKGNMEDTHITAGAWVVNGFWGTDDPLCAPGEGSTITKVNVSGSIVVSGRYGILAATDILSVQAKADGLSLKSEDLPSPDANYALNAGLLIACVGGWETA